MVLCPQNHSLCLDQEQLRKMMVRTLIINLFIHACATVQNQPILVLHYNWSYTFNSDLFRPHITGVVISIISEKNGEGYALVLDGSTFEEVARAKFPYGLPYGLHGCWVPKQ